MSNIIPGLNRRAIKYVIEITKDHFQELDKNNIKGTMHRKLCMKQIPDSVWKLSVWLIRFTGGYIWGLWAFISMVQILYVSKTC